MPYSQQSFATQPANKHSTILSCFNSSAAPKCLTSETSVVVSCNLILDVIIPVIVIVITCTRATHHCTVQCVGVRPWVVVVIPRALHTDGRAGRGPVVGPGWGVGAVSYHKGAAGVSDDVTQLLADGAIDGLLDGGICIQDRQMHGTKIGVVGNAADRCR